MVTAAEYAILSNEVYKDPVLNKPNKGYNLPKGWEFFVASNTTNDSGGYFGAAFKKGNEIVIVHRGTEPKTLIDFDDDAQIFIGNLPDQFASAQAFNTFVKQQASSGTTITYSGHSLGGALAELSAAQDNVKATSFDSPGTKPIIQDMIDDGTLPRNAMTNAKTNITTFNAAPNLVNMANEHVGSNLRLDFPFDIHDNAGVNLGADYVAFSFHQHSMQNFVDAFDPVTGKLVVNATPVGTWSTAGYDDFISYTSNQRYWDSYIAIKRLNQEQQDFLVNSFLGGYGEEAASVAKEEKSEEKSRPFSPNDLSSIIAQFSMLSPEVADELTDALMERLENKEEIPHSAVLKMFRDAAQTEYSGEESIQGGHESDYLASELSTQSSSVARSEAQSAERSGTNSGEGAPRTYIRKSVSSSERELYSTNVSESATVSERNALHSNAENSQRSGTSSGEGAPRTYYDAQESASSSERFTQSVSESSTASEEVRIFHVSRTKSESEDPVQSALDALSGSPYASEAEASVHEVLVRTTPKPLPKPPGWGQHEESAEDTVIDIPEAPSIRIAPKPLPKPPVKEELSSSEETVIPTSPDIRPISYALPDQPVFPSRPSFRRDVSASESSDFVNDPSITSSPAPSISSAHAGRFADYDVFTPGKQQVLLDDIAAFEAQKGPLSDAQWDKVVKNAAAQITAHNSELWQQIERIPFLNDEGKQNMFDSWSRWEDAHGGEPLPEEKMAFCAEKVVEMAITQSRYLHDDEKEGLLDRLQSISESDASDVFEAIEAFADRFDEREQEAFEAQAAAQAEAQFQRELQDWRDTRDALTRQYNQDMLDWQEEIDEINERMEELSISFGQDSEGHSGGGWHSRNSSDSSRGYSGGGGNSGHEQ
ncbi:MAG: hypothetical protein K0R63_374 [Rickettsiales bacterium]|jgi:hypothetical protein|nr:hypothetical protein [Rickettsiales bacterium]